MHGFKKKGVLTILRNHSENPAVNSSLASASNQSCGVSLGAEEQEARFSRSPVTQVIVQNNLAKSQLKKPIINEARVSSQYRSVKQYEKRLI